MTITPRAGVRSGRTLAAACLALFVIFLDSTIVNVALPAIQASLGATPEGLEWTVNAYIVAFAGLVLLGGTLGDRFGLHRMFRFGLAVFAAASTVAALSDTTSVLVGARVVQGIGAAVLAPLSLSLLTRAFPQEKLPAAIGIWAGVSGLGLAVGPLVGGSLVEGLGWHTVFWVLVPFAVAAATLTGPDTDARQGVPRRLDAVGAGLVSTGLITTVAGLTRSIRHPWTSPVTVALLGAGALLIAAFILQQRRSPTPLIPVGRLASARSRLGLLVLTLASFGLLGTIWFVALYLQNILGYDAVQAGIRTLPLTVTTLFVAPIAGKIAERRGQLPILAAGLALTVLALAALTRLDADTAYPVFAADLIGFGVGLAMALPAAAAMVIDETPADQVGGAAALATMARQLGGAVGLAALASTGGRVAVEAFHQASAGTANSVRLDDLVAGGQIAAIDAIAGPAARDTAADAFLHGFTTVTWISAAAAAVGLVASISFTRRQDRRTPTPADTAATDAVTGAQA